ncbi:MAG: hypothetical protein IPK07_27125 [Deltaproteobacteria bacterium]|nr:hypothetical protein [Deltaproteobacteria bacterium]
MRPASNPFFTVSVTSPSDAPEAASLRPRHTKLPAPRASKPVRVALYVVPSTRDSTTDGLPAASDVRSSAIGTSSTAAGEAALPAVGAPAGTNTGPLCASAVPASEAHAKPATTTASPSERSEQATRRTDPPCGHTSPAIIPFDPQPPGQPVRPATPPNNIRNERLRRALISMLRVRR